MSDSCVCLSGGDYDYDESAFHDTTMRKARKPHVCCECMEAIAPGDQYEHYASKSEGRIFTVKTCATCAEIRLALYCNSAYLFGELWTDVHWQIFQTGLMNSACLAKLTTVEAKQRLSQRWWEWVRTRHIRCGTAGTQSAETKDEVRF
jgi:hypothetical protein